MEITLRPYQLLDIDHFMSWACDPEVLKFSRLQCWVSHNASRQQVESYFSQVVFPHPFYRAVCFNGQPIGFISVEPGTEHHRARANLAIALGRMYWGRGIATTATRMAVAAAFKEIPGLLRIEAFVEPDNQASQRILEKAGFLKEGFLRKYLILKEEALDLIVYSILASDPIAN